MGLNKGVVAEQGNLLDLIDGAAYEQSLESYRKVFARDHQGPYATQQPGGDWRTKYKSVADPLLKAHLSEKYWVATKASWYPQIYFLDLDAPSAGELERIVESLGLSRGQYLLMSSPSYPKDQSCHIAIKPEYHGKIATHKLGYEALHNIVGRSCEVYPQLKRKFRLPLGRGQRLITEQGLLLDSLPWWEALHWIDKIDPLPIERLRFQLPLPFASPIKKEDKARGWVKSSKVKEIYEYGLQAKGTRHEVTWILAVSLWRANWLPQDASVHIKKWLRKQHNGFSETINKGNWRAVDAEIGRQVAWIWGHFRPYPDNPHNITGYVTMADLKWLAQVYPGDVVNQKRLFALTCYMRPRAKHDWVYVPAHVWRDEIAHKDTYNSFVADLEGKGLLESVMSYRHVENYPDLSYSRKFRLKLPEAPYEPIKEDGRHVQDYYDALLLKLGTVKEIVAFTGVTHQRFYRFLGQKED